MTVHLPSPLHEYTRGRAAVPGSGRTLADVLDALEAKYPGIRFRIIDEQDRIRPTILIHLNGRVERSLSTPVDPEDDVHIIAALSGG